MDLDEIDVEQLQQDVEILCIGCMIGSKLALIDTYSKSWNGKKEGAGAVKVQRENGSKTPEQILRALSACMLGEFLRQSIPLKDDAFNHSLRVQRKRKIDFTLNNDMHHAAVACVESLQHAAHVFFEQVDDTSLFLALQHSHQDNAEEYVSEAKEKLYQLRTLTRDLSDLSDACEHDLTGLSAPFLSAIRMMRGTLEACVDGLSFSMVPEHATPSNRTDNLENQQYHIGHSPFAILHGMLVHYAALFRAANSGFDEIYPLWCCVTLHRLLLEQHSVQISEQTRENNVSFLRALLHRGEAEYRYESKYTTIHLRRYKDAYHVVPSIFLVVDRRLPHQSGCDQIEWYDIYIDTENISFSNNSSDIEHEKNEKQHAEKSSAAVKMRFMWCDREMDAIPSMFLPDQTVVLPFAPGCLQPVRSFVSMLYTGKSPDQTDPGLPRLTRTEEKALASADFDCRDVLIGTLRHAKQLEICLRHRFYYFPAERLPHPEQPIRMVALYQSYHQFGSKAGVRYYGEVRDCIMVSRSAIKEMPKDSDALYYRVTVKAWKKLPHTILPRENGLLLLRTNRFLLFRATNTAELTLENSWEYRFHRCVQELLRRASKTHDASSAEMAILDMTLRVQNDMICLYRGSHCLLRFPIQEYLRRPIGCEKQLCAYMVVPLDQDDT